MPGPRRGGSERSVGVGVARGSAGVPPAPEPVASTSLTDKRAQTLAGPARQGLRRVASRGADVMLDRGRWWAGHPRVPRLCCVCLRLLPSHTPVGGKYRAFPGAFRPRLAATGRSAQGNPSLRGFPCTPPSPTGLHSPVVHFPTSVWERQRCPLQ